MTADGVNFVDEDDAGGVLLALLEEVADAACADADEHLDEVRAGDGEEGDAGFTGDGAGQKGFAGSGRSDEQNAFGNAAAELLELGGLAQEFDDLLQLFLGLFDARNIFEGDLFLLGGVETGAALPEAESFISAALHLAHHKDPESNQQDERGGVEQDGDPTGAAGFLDVDLDLLVLEDLVDVGIVGGDSGVQLGAVILVYAFDFDPVADLDLLDFASIDVADKFSEGEWLLGHLPGASDDLPEQNQNAR